MISNEYIIEMIAIIYRKVFMANIEHIKLSLHK